jgi:transposase
MVEEPGAAMCALRAVMRQRGMLVASQARHVQHMQKALTQMNIQLANAISDIVGETGQRRGRGAMMTARPRRRIDVKEAAASLLFRG